MTRWWWLTRVRSLLSSIKRLLNRYLPLLSLPYSCLYHQLPYRFWHDFEQLNSTTLFKVVFRVIFNGRMWALSFLCPTIFPSWFSYIAVVYACFNRYVPRQWISLGSNARGKEGWEEARFHDDSYECYTWVRYEVHNAIPHVRGYNRHRMFFVVLCVQYYVL